ncbi:hypothetical protein K438DRAFT_139015 [Mycena galopus ATCC 62051]|nr:hypothetical protein K438DRAFT_139015 [Mycena galopus ATCC 62051]
MYTITAPMRHHPWFDMPSVKRKRPASPAESPPRAPKRTRSQTLERGFAGLTLDATMAPVTDDNPVPVPRPSTPDVPEITMKTSSWYEPEPDRIVITDLRSFSDEDDADEASTNASGPQISPALLAHLKRPLAPPVPPPPESQALILFRPLPFAQNTAPKPDTRDDDAMDVEP